MAVLGLRFCVRAPSSCGKRGPLLIAMRGPLTISRCGAQAPDAQAQQSWLTGPAAPRHAGSSQTRARTRVPCISRQILNHCATREAPHLVFDRIQVLAGCWPETSVSCHMDLSTELLTTGQLASPELEKKVEQDRSHSLFVT